jgi:hypothetical protein
MENKSKLNTVLLVIIILLVLGLGYYFFNNSKLKENEILDNKEIINQQDAYTYTNRGFSILLPNGFVPVEEQLTNGPVISISMPVGSLGYITDSSFWEKSTIPSYTYIKEQKIGESTFKVYEYMGTTFYWLKQGNVGYEFGGTDKIKLQNLIKTFKLDQTNTNSGVERKPSRYFCVGEFCDGSGSGEQNSLTILKIPLITPGGNIGCGSKILFAPHAVPKTTAVLDATYKLLFDLKAEPEVITDEISNPVGSYTKLFYESVSIENRTAKVMLTGSMYAGHCSDPDMREQINQSAFQFNTVDKIEVYLNGKLFDWCSVSDADASESKCDEIPRYWIDNK